MHTLVSLRGSVRAAVQTAVTYAADYLAPPICIGCSKSAHWMCRSCNLELGCPPELVCPSCLLASVSGVRCATCATLEVPLKQLISVYAYESRVFHRLLAAYKERGLRAVHTIVGRRLTSGIATQLPKHARPIVVPIPCSKKRKRVRGFDQAELLGNFVSARLGFEFAPQLLVRTKQSGVQKELSRLDRRKQLKGMYLVAADTELLARCRKQGVLLVDDVATSLATLETCAMVLAAAGVRNVRAAVLAHAAIG